MCAKGEVRERFKMLANDFGEALAKLESDIRNERDSLPPRDVFKTGYPTKEKWRRNVIVNPLRSLTKSSVRYVYGSDQQHFNRLSVRICGKVK